MGNFEKLVVLTVLFLSAIVLAFSLSDDAVVEASTPLDAAREALEEGARSPEPGAETAAKPEDPERSGRKPLLNTEITTPRPGARSEEAPAEAPARAGIVPPEGGAPARQEGPAAKDPGTILLTTEGLEETSLEDFRLYVVRSGDTWSSLTRRFYGDARYLPQLRAANEELVELAAGKRILVPVHDLAREAGEREPYEPAARRPAAENAAPREGEVYVVREGDNLSSISKEVFGTTTRWEEIFQANKDVLSSPDWLKVGMKLRIPRK